MKKQKGATRGMAVPLHFGTWLRRQRTTRGQSLRDLERLSGLSIRNLQYLEAGHSRSITEETAARLARALGITLSDFVAALSTLELSFEALRRLAFRVDRQLLGVVNSHLGMIDPATIAESQQAIISAALDRHHLPFRTFVEMMNDDLTRRRLLQAEPAPAVQIHVEENVEWIEFHCDSGCLRVETPELLWDCNCDLLTNVKSKTCRIHGTELGCRIAVLIRNRPVMIQWRGAQFMWEECPELWPPSIDSFQFVRMLEQSGQLDVGRWNTILDLGSGTGFLGVMIARLRATVRAAAFGDWAMTPFIFSALNAARNLALPRKVQVSALLGLYTDWSEPSRSTFDVVLCNPPYLPVPSRFREELATQETVAGTSLLTAVIAGATALCGRLFIQFSNLAEQEAQSAAVSAGVKLVPIGPSRLVPFRIPTALRSVEYVDWLQRDRGLQRLSNRSGHVWWHQIQLYQVGESM